MSQRQEDRAAPSVSVEHDGPVTIITLERAARRNAVDRDMAAALRDALLAFERDDKASVAVLCGKGSTFCAGADLSAYAQWDLPLEEALRQEGAAGHDVVFSEGLEGARAFLSGAGRHGAPRE
jgi:enoyl-CoA hydratase/carnithine racemase